MSVSFSINVKSHSKKPCSSNPSKKPSPFLSDAAETDSSTVNYVREFRADEAPPPPESEIKKIAPILNKWCANRNVSNSAIQFELDPGSNPEASTLDYGLNLRSRQPISDSKLRKLREDLANLPDGPSSDDYDRVPIKGFGAAYLASFGWKEGRGIGRNAKEDVKVYEPTRKVGRGALGFIENLPVKTANSGKGVNTIGNTGEISGNSNVRREKTEDLKDKKGFAVGKEVRIVSGREMGVKGKVIELRDGGDLLVLRISKSNEKVKVRTRDVAEVGSSEEEKCLRKLKKLQVNENDVDTDKRERNLSRKRKREVERGSRERVNCLRNHIRVRIVNKEFMGGKLFLKKGVVVDVGGPGVCDISIDESREIIQGVDEEFLETVIPKRGGQVLVLSGRHEGVYGDLLERDPEKEMAVVRDADTRALLNVKLGHIAEYTGDPSDIGY